MKMSIYFCIRATFVIPEFLQIDHVHYRAHLFKTNDDVS